MTPPVQFCQTQEQIAAAGTLLQALYPNQTADYIRNGLTQMQQEGWKTVGMFDEHGHCVASISYRTGMRLFFGRVMQLDCLYIDPQYRRKKYGQTLFHWLEEQAKTEKCEKIILESTAENFAGHRFFYRLGYFIRGYVIIKPLQE